LHSRARISVCRSSSAGFDWLYGAERFTDIYAWRAVVSHYTTVAK